jgi:CubicO group peptidase (beta-lactamase class C family)
LNLKKYIFFIFLLLGTNYSCDSNESQGEQVDTFVKDVEPEEIKEEVILDFDDDVVSKINHFFSYRKSIGRFNGVILFAKGNTVFKKAYGYANFSHKDSLTTNTSFQLASVSKTVTSTAVLMLKDRGQLELTDSVQKYLAQFPYKGITIEQLLSHRSGLGNYIYWTEKYWKNQDSLMSNNDVLRLMSEYKPAIYYSPNRRYYYNNTNYLLLASIVEKVSGMSFEEFLKENIFTPLKMENSFLLTRSNIESHESATGYKNRRRPYSFFFLDGVHGDKGLYSTVGDLYKFDRALRKGVLLSDSTKADAYTNRSKYYRKPYGLGWRLDSYKGNRIIYHHGWWRGFKTYFIRNIEEDKTIIILSNTVNGSRLNNKMLLKLFDDALKSSSTAEQGTVADDGKTRG